MLCKNNLILAFDFQKMLVQSDMQIRKIQMNKIQSMLHDTESLKVETEEYYDDHISVYQNAVVFDEPPDRVTIIKEPECSIKLAKKTHQCPICQKIFSRPSHLLRHSVVHTKIKRKKAKELKLEIEAEDKDWQPEQAKQSGPKRAKKFKCQLCQKSFTTYYGLQKHSDLHENGYLCKFCKKEFAVKSDMSNHIFADHKEDQKHACDHCDKSFTQKSSLKEHIRTHFPNEKPFLCPICGQAFNLSSSLRHHIQRHDGEKKFVCTDCPSKFLTKSALRSHLLSHTGEKPYICKTCNKGFAKSHSLKKHIRTHTGERMIV